MHFSVISIVLIICLICRFKRKQPSKDIESGCLQVASKWPCVMPPRTGCGTVNSNIDGTGPGELHSPSAKAMCNVQFNTGRACPLPSTEDFVR